MYIQGRSGEYVSTGAQAALKWLGRIAHERLMQRMPELYVDEGAAVSHSFLHLTVQEFMAAFHLSYM